MACVRCLGKWERPPSRRFVRPQCQCCTRCISPPIATRNLQPFMRDVVNKYIRCAEGLLHHFRREMVELGEGLRCLLGSKKFQLSLKLRFSLGARCGRLHLFCSQHRFLGTKAGLGLYLTDCSAKGIKYLGSFRNHYSTREFVPIF